MSFIWPVQGTDKQPFGRPALKAEPTMYLAGDAKGWVRCRPAAFAGATQYADVHPGDDIACPVGTPVRAPATGVLLSVVHYRILSPFTNTYVWGLYAAFRFFHSATKSAILYVDHLSWAAAEGKAFAAGAVFAKTGASGIVTGPHCHMETRVGGPTMTTSQSWAAYRYNPDRLLRGDLVGLLK